MSMRGLLVALLCGVLGVGIGVVVARAAQPGTSETGDARPVTAVSPSVPLDEPSTQRTPTPDITYESLSPTLQLPPPDHMIGNELATWHYRIPAGWQAYAVCAPISECAPPLKAESPLTPQQASRQPEVRYRPANEPLIGGYSLRVKVLDNTLGLNTTQMVSTKVAAFKQAYSESGFQIVHRTPTAVYFTFFDSLGHLRYNYFQWFAASGSSVATLEMSVAGRSEDVPGLKALFNRFGLIVSGTTDPYHPAKGAAGAGVAGG
ncbi:MAG: hypothetical protein QM747_06460 [Nocardioides sp.]